MIAIEEPTPSSLFVPSAVLFTKVCFNGKGQLVIKPECRIRIQRHAGTHWALLVNSSLGAGKEPLTSDS